MQLSFQEMRLLTGKYHYSIRYPNMITYIAFILGCGLLYLDLVNTDYLVCIYIYILILSLTVCKEWIWAKINSKSISFTFIYHLFFIGICASVFYSYHYSFLFVSFIIGAYYRNCPFGVIHGKKFFLSSYCLPVEQYGFYNVTDTVSSLSTLNFLPIFSYAGNRRFCRDQRNVYDVTQYGILPNTREDLHDKVQILINNVGESGGGIIYFPRGKYYFNKDKSVSKYLQINYSNTILEGEVDLNGKPLAILVNCNNTLQGRENPWLSPFFIVTGERIQRSNIFWGLQFKKKKNIITRSGSLADPGSDGSILMPQFATNVIKESKLGEDILYVEDSSVLRNVKYIMLGLYNTSKDGNLIKDILGVEELRNEWGTARRAGDEEAPSFQWLVEIDHIIDSHAIQITQPLRRNCQMKYSPAIFVVEMLENIEIRNLKLESHWNGLFRHHGFPLYYSISQSQEMDYGWNAINMKRVAHGGISNVIIENFANPLYVMDSRNITVEDVILQGYDGHQGIKIYEHACDNLFKNITFYNHYADMLGGEGNAYGNVFTNIKYLNPNFKPVDFDFHGFSEGPMSPPAYNLFEKFYGFRYIKSAGALYNQPACAQYNVWWNIQSAGERIGAPLFISLPYCPKKGIFKKISALRHGFVKVMQEKQLSIEFVKKNYRSRLEEMDRVDIQLNEHYKLYPNNFLYGYRTMATVEENECIYIEAWNKSVSPNSLFEVQKK